jgi:chromosome segregation ATPase
MGLIRKYNISDLPALETELEAAIEHYDKQAEVFNKLNNQKNPNTVKRANALNKLSSLGNTVQNLRYEIKKLKDARDNRNLMNRLQQITEKNDCLRVRFYEWLAAKLEHLAVRIRNHAMKISTPCVVKLPKKKEATNNFLNVMIMGK